MTGEEEKNIPGTVVKADEEGIFVACGAGKLILKEIQLEGKKRMDSASFLRGCKVEPGTRLTDHKE